MFSSVGFGLVENVCPK